MHLLCLPSKDSVEGNRLLQEPFPKTCDHIQVGESSCEKVPLSKGMILLERYLESTELYLYINAEFSLQRSAKEFHDLDAKTFRASVPCAAGKCTCEQAPDRTLRSRCLCRSNKKKNKEPMKKKKRTATPGLCLFLGLLLLPCCAWLLRLCSCCGSKLGRKTRDV